MKEHYKSIGYQNIKTGYDMPFMFHPKYIQVKCPKVFDTKHVTCGYCET